MKLEPCIILKLFLNFSDSEPEYSYKLYSYKAKVCIMHQVTLRMQIKLGIGEGGLVLDCYIAKKGVSGRQWRTSRGRWERLPPNDFSGGKVWQRFIGSGSQ